LTGDNDCRLAWAVGWTAGAKQRSSAQNKRGRQKVAIEQHVNSLSKTQG
jgi:hypothetical protein